MANEAGYLTDAQGNPISATNPIPTTSSSGSPEVVTSTGAVGTQQGTGLFTTQDAVVTSGQVTVTTTGTPTIGPLAVSGLDVATLYVNTTGYTGGSFTFQVQASFDGATSWSAVAMRRSDSIQAVVTGATTQNSVGQVTYFMRCSGATHLRLNVTGFTSGGTSPVLTLTVQPGAETPYVAVVSNGGAVGGANNNPASGSNRMAVATGVSFTLSLNAVTSTGAGSSIDLGVAAANPVMEVLAASVTTGGTIVLQGSLEGTNWYTIGTGTISANGTTAVVSTGNVSIPARFLRANLTVRTDGTYTAWVAAGG